MKEKLKACWKNLPYLPLWARNLILVMFVVGSIGVFMIFSSKSPKCAKAPAQSIYIEKSNQPISEEDIIYGITLQRIWNVQSIERPRTIKIIDISNRIGDYDDSLEMLSVEIKHIRECKSPISSNHQYESLLYQKLAETLKLKGDIKRAEQALAKSKTAKEMATKLLVKEKKQQEKELDKLLADTTIKK